MIKLQSVKCVRVAWYGLVAQRVFGVELIRTVKRSRIRLPVGARLRSHSGQVLHTLVPVSCVSVTELYDFTSHWAVLGLSRGDNRIGLRTGRTLQTSRHGKRDKPTYAPEEYGIVIPIHLQVAVISVG